MDYKEQYDKIYRYCYFRVQNRETAEDITQEAFLRFLKHEEYRGRGDELKLLYTIAGNLCIDEYRRRATAGVQEEFSEEVMTGSREYTYSSKNNENSMFETLSMKLALEQLSKEERELVLLRFVNEVPVKVICELKECSRFALNRRLKQILKKLRIQLAEDAEADRKEKLPKKVAGKERSDED